MCAGGSAGQERGRRRDTGFRAAQCEFFDNRYWSIHRSIGLDMATGTQMEHISRTHDYELFFQTFIRAMKTEGLLDPIISPGKGSASGGARSANHPHGSKSKKGKSKSKQ